MNMQTKSVIFQVDISNNECAGCMMRNILTYLYKYIDVVWVIKVK